MRKLLTGFVLSLAIVSQSFAFGLWGSADMFGAGGYNPLPAQSAQTLALTFDGSIGSGTFARSTQAWSPATGALYAVNAPRYWLTGKQGNSLLFEESSSNILLNNNLLTSWSNVSITPAQDAIGPYGDANSAWTITDNAANVEFIYLNPVIANTTHTFSVWFKKTTGATIYPAIYIMASTTIAGCTIDTNNSTATLWSAYTGNTIIPSSVSVVDNRGDWFRVALTFTPASGTNHQHVIVPAARSNPTASTGANEAALQGSAVIYLPQSEALPYATSPIVTGAASVTRAAETLTYPTAGILTAAQGTVAGWVYVDTAKQASTVVQHVFTHGTTAANNLIRIWKNGANTWGFHVSDAAGALTGADVAQTLSAGWHRLSISWSSAGTVGRIDGVDVVNDTTSVTVPAALATNMYFGSDNSGSPAAKQIDVALENWRVYSRPLTTAEDLALFNRGR